jgi:hemolysin III
MPRSQRYSAAERLADAVIHVSGLALAAPAAVALVVAAALFDGRGAIVAAVAIYAAGLLAMLGCSAAYNMIDVPRWSEVLRRLDHAAIYVKIAATQTPFAVMVGGGHAGWLIGSVWTAALGGAFGKLLFPQRLARISLPLYLVLGWAGVALLWPDPSAAPLAWPTLALIVAGGLLYTAGVGFFLAERLPFHNAIWHAFVLAATLAFLGAVGAELGLRVSAGGAASV